MKIIKFLDKALEKFTTYLLVASVLLMLSLSSLSIVARWFQSNIAWIDPFVRHLVFLSAFLGGIIATGQGTHIGIDVIGKFVESKGWHSLRSMLSKIIMLSSMAVLVWLIKSGIEFTKVELEFGKIEFFGIHSGFLVMIIPIGMGLLLLRFTTIFLLSFGDHNNSPAKAEV